MSTAGDAGDPRWIEARRLFERALEQPPRARPAILAEARNPELRRELEALLQAHEALESRTDSWRFDALDPERAAALLQDHDETFDQGLRNVGPYQIVQPLGRGGMGVVYLARDPRLGRDIALKLLPPYLAADAGARERLAAEARAASALDHPAIATVYDVGETAQGTPFIAMAYCPGETLRDRLLRGPLPIDEIRRVAAQIADALTAAHGAGIVHRDLKPSNVILCRSGAVRLIDFGIAKLAGSHGSGDAAGGTAAYMSPEQTRDESVDHRTDLWSFGVLLYEMLSGVRPFHGDQPELVDRIRNDSPVPVQRLRPDVPESIIRIVDRCLAKQPGDRFASAADIMDPLRSRTDDRARASALASGAASKHGRAGHLRRNVVAGLALVLAIGLGARALWTGGPAPPPGTIAVLPFTNLDADPAHQYLAEGVAIDLLDALDRLPELRVLARTSAAAGPVDDPVALGATLGVAHLLTGAVQQTDDRIRLTARLIETAGGFQVWSDIYEGGTGELLEIERRIAHAVAEALDASPAAGSADRSPVDPLAHDLYLRARHVAGRRTDDGLHLALDYYQRALRRDSTYAPALAGVADAYAMLAAYAFMPADQALDRAVSAALRAVELAPGSAEAHTSLGAVFVSRGAYERAGEAFRTAIQLEPGRARAHHLYGFLLAQLGRLDEALEEIDAARQLDPLSMPILNSRSRILYHAGRADEARTTLEAAIELDPDFPWNHHVLAAQLLDQGRLDEAEAHVRHTLQLLPGDLRSLAIQTAILSARGDSTAARAIRDRIRESGGLDLEYALAAASAAVGETDAAFASIDRVRWTSELTFSFATDPLLRPLRDDERYPRRLRELGVPGGAAKH